METVKEFLGNDSTNIYSVQDGVQRLALADDSQNYYFSPFLSFGDYDNSCHVERSNVRMFEKQFTAYKNTDWVKVKGAYSSESIAIKLLSTNQEIIECLEGLVDYPAIDDEDVSKVFFELENESWEGCYKRDFKNAVSKHYGAFESYMEDEIAWEWYCKLKEKANINGDIQSGGNFYIDLKKLIEELPEKSIDDFKLDY